jgi:hypothetical protein
MSFLLDELARDWGRGMAVASVTFCPETIAGDQRVWQLFLAAEVFQCTSCEGLFGAEFGALDDYPDDCDRCANEKAERQERKERGTAS